MARYIKAKKGEFEKDIQRVICEYLHERGYFFWRNNNIPALFTLKNGGMGVRSLPKFAVKGLPDIMLVLNNRFYGIEVKRAGRFQTPEQREVQRRFMENGAFYLVATTLEDVIGWIPQA